MKPYICILLLCLYCEPIFSQDVIVKNNDKITYAVFTKQYFKNSAVFFTPSENQIGKIERLLKEDSNDFKIYIRQYYGKDEFGEKKIYIRLIPSKLAEKDFPNWQETYLYIFDDTRIRYAVYNIETGKLLIHPVGPRGG